MFVPTLQDFENIISAYGQIFGVWFCTCVVLDFLSFGIFKAFGLLNINKK